MHAALARAQLLSVKTTAKAQIYFMFPALLFTCSIPCLSPSICFATAANLTSARSVRAVPGRGVKAGMANSSHLARVPVLFHLSSTVLWWPLRVVFYLFSAANPHLYLFM